MPGLSGSSVRRDRRPAAKHPWACLRTHRQLPVTARRSILGASLDHDTFAASSSRSSARRSRQLLGGLMIKKEERNDQKGKRTKTHNANADLSRWRLAGRMNDGCHLFAAVS